MAPASAKSMAMANANAQTADMNRIEDNPRRMGNYESGLATVVKAAIRTSLSQDFAPTEPRAHRTSLIDPLHFRSNEYPDFAPSLPPAPAPPRRSLFPGSAAGASFIEVFGYRDLGGRKATGRVR